MCVSAAGRAEGPLLVNRTPRLAQRAVGEAQRAIVGWLEGCPPAHASVPAPCTVPCRRHIFESKRYVEEYRSEDLQRELGVGREELGALAQLLGSDYCEGVAGGCQGSGGIAAAGRWWQVGGG